MSEILDISPLVSPALAVWPGDVPFRRYVSLDVEGDDNITLSSIEATVHLGAHTDAPNHYAKKSAGIGERNLNYYYGPAQVIEVNVPRGARIGPGDLHCEIEAPRVIFKTGSYPDPNHFNDDFAALSEKLIDYLQEKQVQLVGIDTPSIDLCDDKILESHQAVAKHDMAILEGVVLDSVKPGLYTLIALPLKLDGVDASPVRAVLLKSSS